MPRNASPIQTWQARNQAAKPYGSMAYGSMSSDRKSYLPKQRTLVVVLCYTKAIKIGSLKHSLVEELFTHHHHRSANFWLQIELIYDTIDLLQFPLQTNLYPKREAWNSTWFLFWEFRLNCLKIYRWKLYWWKSAYLACYALLNSSTERKPMLTTTDTLAKPAVLPSSWNSCSVRSLAPAEVMASIIRSERIATFGPVPSSDCSSKSGSTASTTITFPPLVGNALKQLRKIVTHSESFQSCKSDCKKRTIHQLHDCKEEEEEEENNTRRTNSEPSWRWYHQTVRSQTCFHRRAPPLWNIWKLAVMSGWSSGRMVRSQTSWWSTRWREARTWSSNTWIRRRSCDDMG